jgi:hypothetical protein
MKPEGREAHAAVDTGIGGRWIANGRTPAESNRTHNTFYHYAFSVINSHIRN